MKGRSDYEGDEEIKTLEKMRCITDGCIYAYYDAGF